MLPRQILVTSLFVAMVSASTRIQAEEKAAPLAVAPSNGNAAEQHQQAWAKYLKLDVEVRNSIGMKLRLIPAGEFMMGSPDSEKDHNKDEAQHLVRITKAFYMGKYEVTQAEFWKVLSRNPSYFSANGKGKDEVKGLETDRCPVENVTWYDAVEFCNKLSEREELPAYYRLASVERNGESIKKAEVTVNGGQGFRLPTEAEWEYACRAGSETPFHFGAENNGRESNIDGRYPYGTTTKGPYLQRTTSVGRYDANKFGLYDMHGNVWEWCSDWYGEKYYTNSPKDDPLGAATGNGRVVRGGSWYGLNGVSRSGARNGFIPDFRDIGLGFRVAAGSPARTR